VVNYKARKTAQQIPPRNGSATNRKAAKKQSKKELEKDLFKTTNQTFECLSQCLEYAEVRNPGRGNKTIGKVFQRTMLGSRIRGNAANAPYGSMMSTEIAITGNRASERAGILSSRNRSITNL
jgi:hypothetical protein